MSQSAREFGWSGRDNSSRKPAVNQELMIRHERSGTYGVRLNREKPLHLEDLCSCSAFGMSPAVSRSSSRSL